METWEIIGIIVSVLLCVIETLRQANSKFDGGEINELDRMYFQAEEPEYLIDTVKQGFEDGKKWREKRKKQ